MNPSQNHGMKRASYRGFHYILLAGHRQGSNVYKGSTKLRIEKGAQATFKGKKGHFFWYRPVLRAQGELRDATCMGWA